MGDAPSGQRSPEQKSLPPGHADGSRSRIHQPLLLAPPYWLPMYPASEFRGEHPAGKNTRKQTTVHPDEQNPSQRLVSRNRRLSLKILPDRATDTGFGK